PRSMSIVLVWFFVLCPSLSPRHPINRQASLLPSLAYPFPSQDLDQCHEVSMLFSF
uniref:Uncharacterized protein n=1 Tax=Cannabis sativa TaxID=3483 RepID=A0A803QRU9_CANSA